MASHGPNGFTLLLVLIKCITTGVAHPKSAHPPLWDKVPSALKDFPRESGQVVVDPWNYITRMGMYKVILEQTGAQPRGRPSDMLWGLPLQHGWQLESGRLRDLSNMTKCGRGKDRLCISPSSWWGCMNYHLATIPFLGAVAAGCFDYGAEDIKVLPPPTTGKSSVCFNLQDCERNFPGTMNKWISFFTHRCQQNKRYVYMLQ